MLCRTWTTMAIVHQQSVHVVLISYRIDSFAFLVGSEKKWKHLLETLRIEPQHINNKIPCFRAPCWKWNFARGPRVNGKKICYFPASIVCVGWIEWANAATSHHQQHKTLLTEMCKVLSITVLAKNNLILCAIQSYGIVDCGICTNYGPLATLTKVSVLCWNYVYFSSLALSSTSTASSHDRIVTLLYIELFVSIVFLRSPISTEKANTFFVLPTSTLAACAWVSQVEHTLKRCPRAIN